MSNCLGVDQDEKCVMWKCGISEVAISTIILCQRMDLRDLWVATEVKFNAVFSPWELL